MCYLSAGVVGYWIDGLSSGRTVGLCVQVRWGYRTYGLNPGRNIGQCVQVRWRHRTDGLSPGSTVGLSAGAVGQFVIK